MSTSLQKFAEASRHYGQGQTTQEASASGPTTDSMIASQVASQVMGGIQPLAGISSLQIDPLLGGNNQNHSPRVAIQQRMTKNFLFAFSTELSQSGNEIVQHDYQINKRWSVGVTCDEVGGVSVDGEYHTKFRATLHPLLFFLLCGERPADSWTASPLPD